MGRLTNLIALILTVGSAVTFYKLLVEPHPKPQVQDEHWGPKKSQQQKQDDDTSTTIRPFKINVSGEVIEDLKARLKRELASNRLISPLEDAGFNYGFNSKYLSSVVGEYWLNKYDWRVREKLLNKYPHFMTNIGGLDIHFQHVKPTKNKLKSRPILLVHGWPGSIVEFQKIIPLLSEPKNSKYTYELVIPSLPGYGWSQAASRSGLSPTEIANIFKRLMKRLGHDRFFIMGGDWGGIVTSDMATVYPENVIAAQSNFCVVGTVISQIRYVLATLLPDILMPGDAGKNVKSLIEYVGFTLRETGYAHIQMTKPDTVGTALTHSPLGLAAYILEKFSGWTNSAWINREDGGLTENFTMDELIDNVMVYWVTSSITSSQRLYKEMMNPSKKHQLDRVPTSVPFSCQFLHEEILIQPEFAIKDKYTNITSFTITDHGGHFGAFEVPELVAADAISHFDKF